MGDGAPISNLILLVTSDTESLLSWEYSSDEASYEIYISTDNITFSLLDTTSDKTYSDTSLTEGVKYYYRIRAVIGSIYSRFVDLGLDYVYMRFWETKGGVNNVYYCSCTGTGTDSSFANPSTFSTAIDKASSANDVVLFKPGIYRYVAGVELTYKSVKANGVIISSLYNNRDSVVIDFENNGDSVGWLYINGKIDVSLQNITIANRGTSTTGNRGIEISGISSGNISGCKFLDFGRRAILILGTIGQGKWTIKKNIFQGCAHDAGGDTTQGNYIHIAGGICEYRYSL